MTPTPEWYGHAIKAEWHAPATVHAFTTTRAGGVSRGPWSSFNLGARCGDVAADVSENRKRLADLLGEQPRWLHQVHGTQVVEHPGGASGVEESEGDAILTSVPGAVCAVLTADCLPVVLCDRRGERVGVAHAGWRGLAAGVLEAAVLGMRVPPGDLLAWMGPAIGSTAFEVGSDVLDAFAATGQDATRAFARQGTKWHADLFELARARLRSVGVTEVSGGGLCTHSEPQRFFSYRRDGVTGRMATCVWISPGGET